MRGNTSKDMTTKMKRIESLKSKLGGSYDASKFDREGKNRKKMVMIFSNKGKIIFSECSIVLRKYVQLLVESKIRDK
jgi:hypothetical protein